MNIWKNSIELVSDVYSITTSFPDEEKFGLVSQVRRCAVSIPSNIAEGAARKNDKEFIQFLYVALGSLSELDTQMIISRNLGYLKHDDLFKKLEDLGKSISSFIKYLKSLEAKKSSF